jgi:hypothetical protein
MKNCYIISYDLIEGSNYEKLIETIKAYKIWAHLTQSTWAIVTEVSASQIRDDLLSLIGDGKIIVIKSGSESAWTNLLARSEWLKKYL